MGSIHFGSHLIPFFSECSLERWEYSSIHQCTVLGPVSVSLDVMDRRPWVTKRDIVNVLQEGVDSSVIKSLLYLHHESPLFS